MNLCTLCPPAHTSYSNHTQGDRNWHLARESNRSVGKRERVCNLRQMGNGSWHGSQGQASLLQIQDAQPFWNACALVGLPGMRLKGLCMGGQTHLQHSSPPGDFMVCGKSNTTSVLLGSELGHFISFLENNTLESRVF